MKKSAKILTAVLLGTVLFFVLGRWARIPTPLPDVTLCLQYGVLGFMAVLFGPLTGLLIGLLGHLLADLTAGGAISWSWIAASAFVGMAVGLSSELVKLKSGAFRFKKILIFNFFQLAAHLIAWILIAPFADLVWGGAAFDAVFRPGLRTAIANFVTAAVIGTVLCALYAGARKKHRKSK